jgi:hypothetical protein
MTTRVELVGSSFMIRFGFGCRSILPQSKAIYFNPISFKLGIHLLEWPFGWCWDFSISQHSELIIWLPKTIQILSWVKIDQNEVHPAQQDAGI